MAAIKQKKQKTKKRLYRFEMAAQKPRPKFIKTDGNAVSNMEAIMRCQR